MIATIKSIINRNHAEYDAKRGEGFVNIAAGERQED